MLIDLKVHYILNISRTYKAVDIVENLILFSGVPIWESLPSNIIELTNSDVFYGVR